MALLVVPMRSATASWVGSGLDHLARQGVLEFERFVSLDEAKALLGHGQELGVIVTNGLVFQVSHAAPP
jgi:hypothetical protein